VFIKKLKIEFMLKSISWTAYWTVITIALIIYYATIFGKYYLVEIKQLLRGNSNLFLKIKSDEKITTTASVSPNKSYDGIKNNDEEIFEQEYNDEIFSQTNLLPVINQFTDEIKNALEYALRNKLIKQELIFSLQNIFQKYQIIKKSAFKSSITNYTLIECLNFCSIHLEDNELQMLWER
jgi:hypothetical protein